MSKHWRPGNKDVRGRFGGRGGTPWLSPEAYRALGPSEKRVLHFERARQRHERKFRPVRARYSANGLSGAVVGVVLAAAACAGIAVGLEQAGGDGSDGKPSAAIQWSAVQGVPLGEVSAADRAWARRAEQGEERPSTSSGRAEVGETARAVRASPSISSGQAFGLCHSGGGSNCVVDGDTFWIGGEKVRIAGIDAPETHPPHCAYEAQLGDAATAKLRALLNSGAVTMTSIDRDRDRYGRLLRNVAVDGADVGEAMVGAGVARDYGSGRRSWCYTF